MAGTKLAVSVVLISCCVAIPQAGQLDSARPAIDAYGTAIQAAEQEASHGRLEAAFKAVGPLRQALLRHREGGVGPASGRHRQGAQRIDVRLFGSRRSNRS